MNLVYPVLEHWCTETKRFRNPRAPGLYRPERSEVVNYGAPRVYLRGVDLTFSSIGRTLVDCRIFLKQIPPLQVTESLGHEQPSD